MDTNKRATHFSGLMIGSVVELAAARSLDANRDSGKTFITGVATVQTFTLPAATGSNAVYRFVVDATATGDKTIQVDNATDEFRGALLGIDTDTTDTLAAYPALDADGFDTITLNGTTTGGIGGDTITVTDMASGLYLIEGTVIANGIVATPLTAAV